VFIPDTYFHSSLVSAFSVQNWIHVRSYAEEFRRTNPDYFAFVFGLDGWGSAGCLIDIKKRQILQCNSDGSLPLPKIFTMVKWFLCRVLGEAKWTESMLPVNGKHQPVACGLIAMHAIEAYVGNNTALLDDIALGRVRSAWMQRFILRHIDFQLKRTVCLCFIKCY
jgi:hypothetical protein